MKKIYYLCTMCLALFLIGATVLLVQGRITGSDENLAGKSMSVGDSVTGIDQDDVYEQSLLSGDKSASDINWAEVHEQLAQNYTGTDFEKFFSDLKESAERNYAAGSDPSGPYGKGSSSVESIPSQDPPESPAKGHWGQIGEYWNPVTEEMTPLYEWVPD
ncbi:MAG: hypothetical protein LBC03_02125 [Nitrososphaerota archaeon]|jgi:hypothetical protein|nr:hypothetical protein [Nitrososphaerota archaeon]